MWYVAPGMRLLPGEPRQKCVFYPWKTIFFYQVILPEKQLGGFCWEKSDNRALHTEYDAY